MQENVGKKLMNSSKKTIGEQSISFLTWLESVWSLPGDLVNMNMHRVAVQFVPPALDTQSEASLLMP